MLPSRSGISAEAINIVSTSLQQRESISLGLFFQCPHFRNGCPELLCKKAVVKNFANSQVFPLAQVFGANFVKF